MALFETAFPITTDIKFFNVSHNVNISPASYLLNTVTTFGLLRIYKITNGEVEKEFIIDISTKLPRQMKTNFSLVIIERLDCLYFGSVDFNELYTLFIWLTFNNYGYLYQVNMVDKEIVGFEPVLPLYQTKKVYLGYSDVRKVTYSNDGNEQVSYIRGLLFIDTDDSSKIGNKYVRRIPVYVTDDDKQNLLTMTQSNDINLPYDRALELVNGNSVYPIVDNWSSQYPVVLRLPGSVKDSQFDFSSGLGVLSFDED